MIDGYAPTACARANRRVSLVANRKSRWDLVVERALPTPAALAPRCVRRASLIYPYNITREGAGVPLRTRPDQQGWRETNSGTEAATSRTTQGCAQRAENVGPPLGTMMAHDAVLPCGTGPVWPDPKEVRGVCMQSRTARPSRGHQSGREPLAPSQAWCGVDSTEPDSSFSWRSMCWDPRR